jgi:predicted RNase H-like nuclease (RuvC/YqgF family)
MKELVETYSIQEFLLFLITFALGVKGLITFYDWAYERLKRVFSKEVTKEQKISSIQEQMDEYKQKYEALKKEQGQLQNDLKDLNSKLDLLIASDKDEIKSFITREHHYFCYEKKWIDDYSMDCIEKRFEHYKAENGNSFIKDLMNELRNLPKKPPQS